MLAAVFQGIEKIGVEQVSDPVIRQPEDIIVRTEATAICGSDLHVYFGRERGLDPGTVMGHEFVGEVVATGRAVRRIPLHARVMVPFTTSCGQCHYCRKGLTARCLQGQLFGWVQDGRGLHGGQAAYVRVPWADTTAVPLNEVTAEQGLLLGDILSTGYHCARQGWHPGLRSAVLIGYGPVGMMVAACARYLGVEDLLVVDADLHRRQMAQDHGFRTAAPEDKESLQDQWQGQGSPVVLEAVGGTGPQALAYDLVQAGGVISSVGVHTTEHFAFSPVQAYDKNITYRSGRCPARYYMPLLQRLVREEKLKLPPVFSHTFPLQEAATAYHLFAHRSEPVMKIKLQHT